MLEVIIAMYLTFNAFLVYKNDDTINKRENILTELHQSIVMIEDVEGTSRGSGFVVLAKSGTKMILTNAHVCETNNENSNQLFIVFNRSNGQILRQMKEQSSILKLYSKHDLCVISLPSEMKDVDPIVIATKAGVDERIFILGFPAEPLLSISEGNIRGTIYKEEPYSFTMKEEKCVGEKFFMKKITIKFKGVPKEFNVCHMKAHLFFTDAPTDHGASGSPLLNTDGEAVGVISRTEGRATSYGSAVPFPFIVDFLSTL